MFTIQYLKVNGECGMQTFDSKDRQMLAAHLARFDRPIVAVYEQATVITKATRNELKTWPGTRLSRAAREFVMSRA